MKEFSQKLHTLPVDRVHSNITAAERQAITSLSNNKNIIIRPVDKGGGIVIMDTAYYVRMVEEHLANGQMYSELKL